MNHLPLIIKLKNIEYGNILFTFKKKKKKSYFFCHLQLWVVLWTYDVTEEKKVWPTSYFQA
jgi:hypothetical protein